jgi:hypothetical protein
MASPNDLANNNIYTFMCVFVVYFVLLMYMIISGKDYNMLTVYFYVVLFIIITFVVQLGSNTYLTSRKEICGKTDISSALSSTFYPWIFIYSILMILVIFIPGWLRLFSNTFGLYAANAYGLKTLLSTTFFILNLKPHTTENTVMNLINSIYNEPTLLINELDPLKFIKTEDPTTGNINIQWESYDKIKNSGLMDNAVKDTNKIIELYKMILLKDTVGISVWLFIGGIISVLISTNTLLNTRCKQGGIKTDYNAIFNS